MYESLFTFPRETKLVIEVCIQASYWNTTCVPEKEEKGKGKEFIKSYQMKYKFQSYRSDYILT